MLKKIGELLGVLVVLYGVATYGGWFLASFFKWSQGAEHGCLMLGVSPQEITADIKSGLRKNGNRIHTSISGGLPILFWVKNGKFSINDESRKQSGSVKLALSARKLQLDFFYSGTEPFSESIVFKRVSECPANSTVYDH